MAKEVRHFVLQENGQDTEHVFTGKQPRQAALKAATRGFTDIQLRERGRKKIHLFTGSVEEVAAPANRPSWLPARVKKAKVEKLGIKKL
ncbi:MAG: non-histone chromosomal MC1 family protein [Candidatus Altiarchaeota archaeon]